MQGFGEILVGKKKKMAAGPKAHAPSQRPSVYLGSKKGTEKRRNITLRIKKRENGCTYCTARGGEESQCTYKRRISRRDIHVSVEGGGKMERRARVEQRKEKEKEIAC
jgi:hypothetical protein